MSDLVFLFKYILLSFLYCAVLKEEALNYLVKITIIGAGISIFFYFIQLINGDIVFFIGSLIHLPPRTSNPDYTNFLIFTFDRNHSVRNSGFAWEPGAFGCLLNMALLMYFFSKKFVFDKNVLLLILAIITTLSTTSYIALMVNLLIYYRGNGGKFSKVFLFAAPVIAVAAVKVPFLFGKIIELYKQDLHDVEHMETLGTFYLKHGGQLPLNRFGSVIYIYRLFGEKLVWGISNMYQDAVTQLANVNISNGIIDFIAKFGLIGLFYLIYRYAMLFKKFVSGNELVVYAVLVVLILSFGEPILIWQNVLAFFFLYHYSRPADELDVEDTSVVEQQLC
ncbi:hypothetical protein SNE25_09145 [Mucilaginibacter sabulilitoris]|uniref:Oligosaccharide repeat unit polymerase n=1 Tax=Mucilaginibacter sabulilitoris TaxID=1173583 RepID=A0ABZ0TRZ7_9SPHI|nr:hypothetical protein [Mucilaginibacter sabulilitoris]WPU95682.1 hypothetical protein SNE25_09145 [Mucilaginibacter sabulilitoris]